MQRGGICREMEPGGPFEKPSERWVREEAEAVPRARKLARKTTRCEGLRPALPKPVPGAC